MKIAYICYEVQERYVVSSVGDEDSELLTFLQGKGLDIHREIWTDKTVNWQQYDVAVLKSPWDYIDKIAEFYQWLEVLEQHQIRLLNPVNIVKWNSDKHYLKDIADAGLAVTPSAFLEQGTQVDLTPYFDHFNTHKLIVKPCVSGGSKNTFAITRQEVAAIQPQIQALVEVEAFLVQPFIKEIETEGEWSLLFFNGRFSHSLLKKPKAGDFKVQHYLGGTIHPQLPSAAQVESAATYVAQFAKGCLYARVDGVVVDGQFLLMELELIEPLLYLFTHPESYTNYYQALTALL
jgi:hypothetical protein